MAGLESLLAQSPKYKTTSVGRNDHCVAGQQSKPDAKPITSHHFARMHWQRMHTWPESFPTQVCLRSNLPTTSAAAHRNSTPFPSKQDTRPSPAAAIFASWVDAAAAVSTAEVCHGWGASAQEAVAANAGMAPFSSVPSVMGTLLVGKGWSGSLRQLCTCCRPPSRDNASRVSWCVLCFGKK